MDNDSEMLIDDAVMQVPPLANIAQRLMNRMLVHPIAAPVTLAPAKSTHKPPTKSRHQKINHGRLIPVSLGKLQASSCIVAG